MNACPSVILYPEGHETHVRPGMRMHSYLRTSAAEGFWPRNTWGNKDGESHPGTVATYGSAGRRPWRGI